MQKPLLAIATLLLVVTIGVYGYIYFLGGETYRSPQELAETALNAGSDEEKEKAARKLADWAQPDRDSGRRQAAQEQMRRVMQNSSNPEVRIAVIQGLGEMRDMASVPDLIKVVRSPRENERLRGAAAVAISNILQYRFNYRTDDPDADRQRRAIDQMDKEYQRQLTAPKEDK